MKITTLFNPGENVFVLVGTKLEKKVISSVEVDARTTGIKITYWVAEDLNFGNQIESFNEIEVFKSEASFLNQLYKAE